MLLDMHSALSCICQCCPLDTVSKAYLLLVWCMC